MTANLRLTVLRGAYDKTPIAEDDLTWDNAADEIAALANESCGQDKRNAYAFNFCELTEPYNVNANVARVTALWIDVDELDLPVALENVAALGVAALVYESASSTDEAPRVRIVAPLSEPLAPDEVKHARHAFAEAIGIGPGQGVETADAVSQIAFAGRLDGTRERKVWRFEGATLDAATLACAALEHTWKKPAPTPEARTATRDPLQPEGERGSDRVSLVASIVAPHYAAGGRHELVRALGGYLATFKFGTWRDADIKALVEELRARDPAVDTVTNRIAQTLEAAAQARAGGAVTAGWQVLRDRLGTDDADALELAAHSPAWLRMLEREAARVETPLRTAGPELADDFDWDAPEVPIEWFCRGLMIAPSERKITLIAGDPGAGKGPLANYLAVCFAFGLRAFGEFDCRRSKVGILDFEGARLTARRVRSQARGLSVDPREVKGLIHLRDCDPGLDVPWIAEWIAEREIEVLIVDSYMSASSASGVDPNSPEFADFARALGTLGIVVIIVAHARKPSSGKTGERPALGDVAGSFALGALAQTAISVWNPDLDNRNLQRVGCMRAPEGVFATFDLRWDQSGTDEVPVWRASIADRAATDEDLRERATADAKAAKRAELDRNATDDARTVIDYLKRFGNWAAKNKIQASTVTEPRVKAALLALVTGGIVTEDLSGAHALYFLPADAPAAARVSVVAGRVVVSEPVAAASKFRRPAGR